MCRQTIKNHLMLNNIIAAGSFIGKIAQKIFKKDMLIIDVSHHQGKINWPVVATKNTPKIDGVIIKSSTGVGSKDPLVDFNSRTARANGLKIGYYHYCSLNEEDEIKDATEEANWFINVLKTLPPPDYPVVLDIEDPKKYPGVSLDQKEILTWIKTFFSVLKQNGYNDYVLYSYTPFLNTNLPDNHDLGDIKLWIAQYRSTLTLPKGWKKYWLWQYTSEGSANGISTKLDLNKA